MTPRIPSPSPRRTLIRLSAVVASAALVLAGCAESDETPTPAGTAGGGAEQGPIKIGAVLDITGAGATLGVPERQTLEMLAEQVNADGGVNGRQIELTIEDNQSTEDGAASSPCRTIACTARPDAASSSASARASRATKARTSTGPKPLEIVSRPVIASPSRAGRGTRRAKRGRTTRGCR